MSRITSGELGALIRARRFAELFIRCGWDREGVSSAPLQLPLRRSPDGRPADSLPVQVVAEKRGFAVCVCDAGAAYPPTRSARRHLVNQLSRHHYEHLLIICGEGKQCWSAAIRPHNRPMRGVEVEWNESQDIQPLKEKLDGVIFDISQEETLGITDVVEQVRGAFMENAESVTRKFYREFRAELSAFAAFIGGIGAQVTREWYAALMLNRLMFIYFIQKKGFLDDDPNYLENRLRQTQRQFGKDRFEEKFYRHFLRRLFAEGLGTPPEDRGPELRRLLGKVPYLNGGLFDLHEIEKEHRAIVIPDAAFENLFAFFGKYRWHLDTRPAASGHDINPDVIGYLFEKYINDRAAMGAYYTQEDITGYIARNTIIPFLLQRAKAQCANAFHADGIWRFLRDNPDHYIYEAARKGCDIPDSELPDNIRRGIDADAPELLARRKDWNTAADERFALPTETWREAIARRARYVALKAKMRRGGIHRIDDLITHNLDIQRFAEDALNNYEGSDFIESFFAAIAGRCALRSNHKSRRGVTVLDPACGSGAFLFAALNVLEPLYRRCIERMEEFIKEDDRLREAGARKGTQKHGQFREVLKEIGNHPNERYWIYKTIILNNLYGVDLMKEAAEIAKLRLFLKLAAEAKYDPGAANLGLEPLPDIDFNIRAGNSLVGFASLAEFESVATSELDLSGGLISQIREDARTVRMADNAFRKAQNYQAQNGKGGEDYRRAKRDLAGRLDALNRNMNRYLAKQYGIDDAKPAEYAQWQDSHKPFHWLAEFYGIVEEGGGFDVVIGNPPYVKYDKSKVNYAIGEYKTEKSKNLYAFFMERATLLVNAKAYTGMIVPVSLVSATSTQTLRDVYSAYALYVSSYADRPGCLFNGVHQQLSICLAAPAKARGSYYSSTFHHWNSKERDTLFPRLHYVESELQERDIWRKLDSPVEKSIAAKIHRHNNSIPSYFRKRGELMSVCGGTGGYWLRAFDEKVSSKKYKNRFADDGYAIPLCAVLNSSVFYWYWRKCSNCRDLRMDDMNRFALDFDAGIKAALADAGKVHLDALKATKEYRAGGLSYDQYRPAKAKLEVDAIDAALAKHYDFTEVELDYLINYDIKYRMGGGKNG